MFEGLHPQWVRPAQANPARIVVVAGVVGVAEYPSNAADIAALLDFLGKAVDAEAEKLSPTRATTLLRRAASIICRPWHTMLHQEVSQWLWMRFSDR